MNGFNEKSNICYTAKVHLWLRGEKKMTSHAFAVADHEESILGYDIIKGKVWQLSNRDVWFFRPTKPHTVIILEKTGKSIS